MKTNKKRINFVIWLLVLIVIFSTITYAKPFTEALRGGLIEINDFFVGEQYKPYAKTIDFFFFSLLFISIYMMGARYAFKEVKKPEKVIAILLGLMTAFLLVLGGFSAVILLPYIQWLLYTLLFIFYWWLLKGIKSKFWRFILALLLTLLTIALIQGLFDALTAPDAEGFFKSLGKSIAAIKFPELPGAPGVPPALRDLFGPPAAPTVPPTITTLPPTVTPTAEAPGKGGIFGSGVSWWWTLLLLLLVFAFKRPRQLVRDMFGGRRPSTIANEIDEIIAKKTTKMNEVKQANESKNQMIQAGESRIAIIEKLEDPSYSWEAVRSIQEGHPLKDLYNKELQLITKLKELIDLEKTDFLDRKLSNWQERIMRETGINDTNKQRIVQQLDELRNLVTHKTTIRDIRNMGILWLIIVCYDFEKREIVLSKELDQLLREHNVDELIRDKFAKVKEDNRKLHQYNSIEIGIIKILNQKIELQKNKLEELKRTITQAPPEAPAAPAPIPQLTVKINRPAPNSEHIIGNYIDDLEAEAEGPESNLINLGAIAYMQFVWYIEQKITLDAYQTQRIHVGRAGPRNQTSEPISLDLFKPGNATLIVGLIDTNNNIKLDEKNIPIILVQLPRIRINFLRAIRKERTLLKRISEGFRRIKERIPMRRRKEVEEAVQVAEEAAAELEEFEEKGILERISPALHEISEGINRKVKALHRLIMLKLKGVKYMTKTAEELERLEEERVRALGEAIEIGPVEEGLPRPRRAEVTLFIRAKIIKLKEAVTKEKVWLKRIKDYIKEAIHEGRPDLSQVDLELGQVYGQLELFERSVSERAWSRAIRLSRAINRTIEGVSKWLETNLRDIIKPEVVRQLELFEEKRVEALGEIPEEVAVEVTGAPPIGPEIPAAPIAEAIPEIPPEVPSIALPPETAEFFNDLFVKLRTRFFNGAKEKITSGRENGILNDTQYNILWGVVDSLEKNLFDDIISFLPSDTVIRSFENYIGIIEEIKRIVHELKQEELRRRLRP